VHIVRLEECERLVEWSPLRRPTSVIGRHVAAGPRQLEGIREVTARNPRPIVMFGRPGRFSFMEEAIEAGVSSYNLVGASGPRREAGSCRPPSAIFRRYQKLAGDLNKAEARLEERAIIQKAKTLLMQQRKMDEPKAHAWLRKRRDGTAAAHGDIAAG